MFSQSDTMSIHNNECDELVQVFNGGEWEQGKEACPLLLALAGVGQVLVPAALRFH